MYKLDPNINYIEAYKRIVQDIDLKHDLFERIDECVFLKMASQLSSPDTTIRAGALRFILTLHEKGLVELTEEQLRAFIIETSKDNLEAVEKIDRRIKSGRTVKKPEDGPTA